MPEPVEVLKFRWQTPRGRTVRAKLIRDLRLETGNHLAEILSEMRGADEVPGGLDLRFVSLAGENLDDTNLSSLDLTGADFAKASLVRADLRCARLTGARLVAADLREADLSEADLSEANFTQCRFDSAVLLSCVLARGKGTQASFRAATLSNADLRGAVLLQATFDGAEVGGARLEGAHAQASAFAAATGRPSGVESLASAPPPAPVASKPSALGLEILSKLKLGSGRAKQPEPGAAAPSRQETPAGTQLAQPSRPKTGAFPIGALATAKPRTGSAPAAAAPSAAPPVKSWDVAIASLLPLRGRVSKITVVVDGKERVLFQR